MRSRLVSLEQCKVLHHSRCQAATPLPRQCEEVRAPGIKGFLELHAWGCDRQQPNDRAVGLMLRETQDWSEMCLSATEAPARSVLTLAWG